MVQLLLLLTIVPCVELALLLVLADHTSWQFTLGLIVVTGILGAALARFQGVRCLQRIREQLASGRLPGDPLMDGLMILVAGALLVTPGVLTDLVGFSLLAPPFRSLVRRYVKKRFQASIKVEMPGQWSDDDFDATGDHIIDTKVIENDD